MNEDGDEDEMWELGSGASVADPPESLMSRMWVEVCPGPRQLNEASLRVYL